MTFNEWPLGFLMYLRPLFDLGMALIFVFISESKKVRKINQIKLLCPVTYLGPFFVAFKFSKVMEIR